MSDPGDHLVDAVGFLARRKLGAVDHQNGNVQGAGRVDFCARAGAAGVFRHHKLDAVSFKQVAISGQIEGATRNDNVMLRQIGRVFGGIDKAQQIVVLRCDLESLNLGTPDGQEDAFGFRIKSSGGAFDVRRMDPVIVGGGFPRGAGQCDQGHACCGTRSDGVSAHVGRERMRCVDDVSDVLRCQETGKPVRPAKSANSGVDRLGIGVRNTTRIGKRGGQSKRGDAAGKCAGFGGAAKDQEVRGHV